MLFVLILGVSVQAEPMPSTYPIPKTGLSAELIVKIDGVRSTRGNVLIAVYDNAKDFLRKPENAVATRIISADTPLDEIHFRDLKPGHYTIAIHHDENGDGKMNYNLIGIPTEGFGFSGNKKIYFGPPSFERAQLELRAEPTNCQIEMKYF